MLKNLLSLLATIEMWVVHVFNEICQSPHWLFFWFIFFIVWTCWRQFFPHAWYGPDTDLLVITWTSAIMTGLVEYSMKITQGQQTKKQQEQQELILKLAEYNQELGKKILALVENIDKDVDQITEDLEDEHTNK